jgi:hypothetical protein
MLHPILIGIFCWFVAVLVHALCIDYKPVVEPEEPNEELPTKLKKGPLPGTHSTSEYR